MKPNFILTTQAKLKILPYCTLIVNINDDKKSWLKNAFSRQLFKTLSLSLTFTKVNKYLQISTAAVDPQHLIFRAVEKNVLNCSYVINKTCTKTCPILVTYIKSLKNRKNIKHKTMKIKILWHLNGTVRGTFFSLVL